MNTKTETFMVNGRLNATLVETDDGTIITQVWRYEPSSENSVMGRANVRLKAADIYDYAFTSEDLESVILAWKQICNRHGFRGDLPGNQESRAFMTQTNGRGVLHAVRDWP